jgi:shikimate kinase
VSSLVKCCTFTSVKKHKLIFLTGYMGSGKTALAREMSEYCGWVAVDTDALIEERSGCSIAAFFESKGETAFREAEKELLSELCRMERLIVSTGGGMPCYHGNMEHMNQNGITVYLRFSAEVLYEKLKNYTADRPLLQGKKGDDLKNHIAVTLQEREKYYLRSDIVIEKLSVNAQDLLNIITASFPEVRF